MFCLQRTLRVEWNSSPEMWQVFMTYAQGIMRSLKPRMKRVALKSLCLEIIWLPYSGLRFDCLFLNNNDGDKKPD